MTATQPSVAQIILQQLGGRRFIAMTGAQNLSDGGDYLSFKLPSNITKNRIGFVKIRLTPMDLYHVQFIKLRALRFSTENFAARPGEAMPGVTIVSEHEEIYAEDLCRLFTAETGLEVSL